MQPTENKVFSYDTRGIELSKFLPGSLHHELP